MREAVRVGLGAWAWASLLVVLDRPPRQVGQHRRSRAVAS